MGNGNYIAYTFETTDEIVLALLSVHPFVSFEEHETTLIGYIAEDELDNTTKAAIITICTERNVAYTSKIIPPQNWNAQWEASFQPVDVDDFCRIRADFHEPKTGTAHDIVINPKMAFGTGHHETTYMMIDSMQSIDFEGKRVLDFGCGTGILAILAEKLGAASIDAIDIEQESYENTLENTDINNCSNITAQQGELDQISNTYDIILANINRHVLLTTPKSLHSLINTGGILLMSGILLSDIQLVNEAYTSVGFHLKESRTKGEWTALLFEK